MNIGIASSYVCIIKVTVTDVDIESIADQWKPFISTCI